MTAGAATGDHRAKAQADPFENVVRFEPITGRVLRSRLPGRRLPGLTGSSMRFPSAGFSPTPEAEVWQERMRRELASKRRSPLGIEKRYLCERDHVLLWLVRSPWGVTPIARTATGFRMRGSSRDDGAPMSLWEWPAGEHLPIAACRCHPRVEVSVHQARSWMESPRDSFRHKP